VNLRSLVAPFCLGVAPLKRQYFARRDLWQYYFCHHAFHLWNFPIWKEKMAFLACMCEGSGIRTSSLAVLFFVVIVIKPMPAIVQIRSKPSSTQQTREVLS